MKGLFFGCKSLTTLPDISKWNTNNITNMNDLFYNCKSLSSLPDISKWGTNNIIYINDIFFGCDSLVSIPDISKWNIDKLDTKNIRFLLSLESNKESQLSSGNSFLSNNSNETKSTQINNEYINFSDVECEVEYNYDDYYENFYS